MNYSNQFTNNCGKADEQLQSKVDYLPIVKKRCLDCGAPISGVPGKDDGFYSCLNYQHGRCNVGNVPKAEIESYLKYSLIKIAEEEAWKKPIASLICSKHEQENAEQDAYVDSLKEELYTIECKLKTISDMTFSESNKQTMNNLERQKNLLKEHIAVEEHRAKKNTELEDVLRNYDELVNKIDREELCRYLVENFIDRVDLNKNKMVLVFNNICDTKELFYDKIRLDIILEELQYVHMLEGSNFEADDV